MINPPQEFVVPGQPNSFQVPADFETLWRARGWRAAKFKTRGSGEFDSGTSTLYILYVPGSSFNPALGYDRYIQFSLPTAEDYAREARHEAPLPPFFPLF